MDNAANKLEGITLKSGWLVKKKIEKYDNQTGSIFSVCYKAEKNGVTCFLKAFDFSKFFMLHAGKSAMEVLNEMSSAYLYEEKLSNFCKNKHVKKVAFVIEAGQEIVNGYAINIVPYLIFELADGDVRKKLTISKNLDYAWRLKSLHDVAIGLNQLHKINVMHQDLKPSNILVFSDECKIGDLGRSLCNDIDSPLRNISFSGDFNHAPPEILYNYYDPDLNKRAYAADCYLLGSLIVFYFSGFSMNALLIKHIEDCFSWPKWTGSFTELEPYLEHAFSKALKEFEHNIDNIEIKKGTLELVEYLCNPIPAKRGHPKSIASIGSNYSLERFVSMLATLQKKAEVMVTHG